MSPNLQLLEFKTPDGLMLPGLLFAPKRKTKKVALVLHGNGGSSVFYKVAEQHTMARALNARGIAYFPFNNRGAHWMHKLTRIRRGIATRVAYGMAYERIKECIYDIDGAIAFLRKRGYREFYLIGGSTGANKICVYNYYKPRNPVSKYVLVGGGDDSGIYYRMYGKKKFFAVLKEAKRKIQRGRGRDLVPSRLSPTPISYQSLYDTINPNGNYNTFPFNEYFNKLKLSRKKLFREYASIKKPTFVIYGMNDQFCYGRVPEVVEILKQHASPVKSLRLNGASAPKKFMYTIIPGADHGISEKLPELARIVSRWLAK